MARAVWVTSDFLKDNAYAKSLGNILIVETIDYSSPSLGRDLKESLRSSGFAVLRNQPIAPERVSELYLAWAEFFATDDKFSYLFEPSRQEGYFPLYSENAKSTATKDLKEFFHVYSDARLPPNLEVETRKIFGALLDLGTELLELLEKELPKRVARLFSIPMSDMLRGSEQNLLRVVHYPPIDNPEIGAMRAAPHEDINLITLLLPGSRSGLQALDADGQWHDVPHDPGTITINTGDMLSMASDHYFPSTTHRVVNPRPEENVSRYSMPMFLHPRPEVLLRSNMTANAYRLQRLEEIGLAG